MQLEEKKKWGKKTRITLTIHNKTSFSLTRKASLLVQWDLGKGKGKGLAAPGQDTHAGRAVGALLLVGPCFGAAAVA